MTEVSEIWSENQRLIIGTVRDYVGCSLSNRRDELAELVCAPGDDPEQAVRITTNCGMFALGVWRHCQIDHELLRCPYKSGMAIDWVLQIARDKGALVRYSASGAAPAAGSLLHWANDGKPNDHVAFCISDPDDTRQVELAGGGAADNAITSKRGPWSWNWGRPLQHVIDCSLLMKDLI